MSLLHLFYAFLFFFFNDTATTEIYTLSLHDALPISMILFRMNRLSRFLCSLLPLIAWAPVLGQDIIPFSEIKTGMKGIGKTRSEEHTSELQSLAYLVCRLLLEKKKNTTINSILDCHN